MVFVGYWVLGIGSSGLWLKDFDGWLKVKCGAREEIVSFGSGWC